jgi:hypothetical protein
MNEIEELIQERWRRGQVPLMDGILYQDGSMVLFSYERVEHQGERGLSVSVNGRTTLAEHLAEDPDIWTFVLEMDAVVWEEGGLRIACGGGGYGSDGFVAATRLQDDSLVWVAFSQRSNPFRTVDLLDASVVATTELGQVWRFGLPRPEPVVAGWPDTL